MVLRIAMDLGDAALLSARADSDEVRRRCWRSRSAGRASTRSRCWWTRGATPDPDPVRDREAGGGAVGPDHQRGPAGPGAQPVGGVAARARRPRSRRCRPRSARTPTTLTEATPRGARPVRASTRCAPRCAVPEVATAPVWTGSTASTRPDRAGPPPRPARRARPGRACAPPCRRRRRGRSRCRPAPRSPCGGAFDGPALDHAAGVQPLAAVRPRQPGARTRRTTPARRARPAPAPRATSGGPSSRSTSPRSSRETNESSRQVLKTRSTSRSVGHRPPPRRRGRPRRRRADRAGRG